MQNGSIVITEEEDGNRLDKVLAEEIAGRSRSFLQKMLKEGQILLNGKEVKPSFKVKTGDFVSYSIPDDILPKIVPENIPLDILYEDNDVLVVNKPKGMVVHPAPGHNSGTLVNAVLYHCKDSLSGINGVLRPGIVHRIDKDTTGSVLVCKNDMAHQNIARQLKEHSIVRRYLAICCGDVPWDDLTIEKNIGRDPKNRKKMAVVPENAGKNAITHVHVLAHYSSYAFLECRLETGRTHQIRVHMAYIGHPLLGDAVYGGKRKFPMDLDGQCLHASILGFIHPSTGNYIETKAPLPDYFSEVLQILSRNNISS